MATPQATFVDDLPLQAEVVVLLEKDRAVLRFSENTQTLVLELVMVPSRFRGRGIGTLLVRRLLLLADALGKPVVTTARPIGRSTPEALEHLVAYYSRLGFQISQRGLTSVKMCRPLPKEVAR